MKGHKKSTWQGEEGATAAMFALMLLALLGMAAVSIDVGSLWDTKRNVLVDTDAAALAAAAALSGEPCVAGDAGTGTPAGNAARAYLGYNGGAQQDISVTVDCFPYGATVEVTARQQAVLTVAPAVTGTSEVPVLASSTAQLGPAASGTGARPLVVCLDHPAVQAFLGTGDPGPFTLMYSKHLYDPLDTKLTHPDVAPLDPNNLISTCAEDGGNWGLTCFEGTCGKSANKEGDIGWMIENGYDDEIDLGDPPSDPLDSSDPNYQDGDCDFSDGSQDPCTEGTGFFDAQGKSWDTLECNTSFALPDVYSPAADDCPVKFSILVTSGVTASGDYHPSGLLGVVLRDSFFKGNDYGWLTFEFTELTTVGRIGPVGFNSGLQTVNLCGVDHDPAGDDNCIVRNL